MRHFIATIETAAELDTFLQRDDVVMATASARSLLLQVFSGQMDLGELESLLQRLQISLPDAVVVGVSSSGEIAQGQVYSGATVLSLLCFSATVLSPIVLDCHHGEEIEKGEAIGRHLSGLEHLRGVLLLAPPVTLDCANLLSGIESQLPGVTLFGGGAGMNEAGVSSLVFGLGKIFDSGAVAVGLTGKSLHIETDLFLGWEGLGPCMTLTSVEDNRIRTIDDQPAFDVYSRYLRIEPGDELFLLEFPLLLEREGHTIARNPVSSDAQGAVTMVADVYAGEQARLGYLHIDTVIEAVRGAFAKIQAFQPEALLLYSCICRRFSLQQEIELETAPFQQLAPVAGFFTYGEFTRLGGRLQLLNSSQVVVVMREGMQDMRFGPERHEVFCEMDRSRMRHIRVTSRLFQFISALTEELEAANRMLRHEAEHDALTGAYNRHRLDTALHMELSRSKRYGWPLSLVMFDIDHFKQVNDQFGHAVGDYVLKAMVQTAEAHLRGHDWIFRYGGEEFLLLLPESDVNGATAVAERIRGEIAHLPLHFKGKSLPSVTASFGIATAAMHGWSAGELLEVVDAALYRAKESGRNRVVVAEPPLSASIA